MADVGEHRQPAGRREAEPGTTGVQVAPGEDFALARLRRPPCEAGRRTIEVFVAIGSDNEREAPILVERQGDQAHASKTSTWRAPLIKRPSSVCARASMCSCKGRSMPCGAMAASSA